MASCNLNQIIALVALFLSFNVTSVLSRRNFLAFNKTEVGPGTKLFLTPHIKSGNLSGARKLSRVQMDMGPKITSYSGFLTVNETYNSNMFFWFFPAQSKDKNAPLILWCGYSSLFGLFIENGPFTVDEDTRLHARIHDWTQNHSVIYIDSPVGTGYSFTQQEAGHSRTDMDQAQNLFVALTQFFKLFPKFKTNDLYLAGEGNSGKDLPTLAWKIHESNIILGKTVMNLKGLAISAPNIDPMTIAKAKENYLYSLGLLDMIEKKQCAEMGKRARKLYKEKQFSAADKIFTDLTEFIANRTGYESLYHPGIMSNPPEYKYYIDFIEEISIRLAIHVGDTPLKHEFDKGIDDFLFADSMSTALSKLDNLLGANYRILLMAGQFDMTVPLEGIRRSIQKLKWGSRAEFIRERKLIWRHEGEIVGYVKKYDNLMLAILRNAGHIVIGDQSSACLELITRFTRDEDLVES